MRSCLSPLQGSPPPLSPLETNAHKEMFGELLGESEGPCKIPKTEERAVSLAQLEVVTAHIQRRLSAGEVWMVPRPGEGEWWKRKDYALEEPLEASLYDVCDCVIKPATKPFHCSLVELMAVGAQPPDYFVSQCVVLVHRWFSALSQPT